MCYQNCTKYECPSCGVEPVADQRSYILCLRNSGCRWLYSAPETLPRQVTFEPGPLCSSCRQAHERQRHSARNTAQNSGCSQPGVRQRRQSLSHQQQQSYTHQAQHEHTQQRQQPHTYQRPRSYSRHRPQSYGQSPSRDTRSYPRHEDYLSQQDHYLTRRSEQRQRQRQSEPEWTEDPYLPEPQVDGVNYENWYRDHGTEVTQVSPQEPGRYSPHEHRRYYAQEPMRYSPQRAYRTRPSSPPPLRRRHTTSGRGTAGPRRRYDYESRYRAPNNRAEATPVPMSRHADRGGEFSDDSPGEYFSDDDFGEYRNEYWILDARSRRYR
ncbi:hypothetical protein LTR84_005451 [Exophiala bonariae]|uniref:Uncharacterized protein n=1 Tax=Exophiala bonariae TaxID=1690606 RepID=A0AAV9N7Z1_9EURO|nr:hypothetical protein LTR84_005451 [Exophiala bonariae]